MGEYLNGLFYKAIPIKLKVAKTCAECKQKRRLPYSGCSCFEREDGISPAQYTCTQFGKDVMTDVGNDAPLPECLAERFEIKGEERDVIHPKSKAEFIVRVLTHQLGLNMAHDDLRPHLTEIAARYNALAGSHDFTTAAIIAKTEWLDKFLRTKKVEEDEEDDE